MSKSATSFAPIAIVGRACVLPGALSPEALWELVRAGRDLLRPVPEGRWRIDRERALCHPEHPEPDRTWSDRGGYVEGFETIFDPTGFDLPPDEVLALDPLFQWVLHTAREALRDTGSPGKPERVGAVFGNLSFPSGSMSRYAEAIWRGEDERPHPRNRFNSGLPALLLERALGLGAGALALDAACASSLVAIKLACDRLHDGRADRMLAGAVNRTDDLFIHVGFSALQALSKSGRSRPFHAEADGLMPAEGAGFVALERLADAERAGRTIYGVIRGVGLSNDGRGRGFLVPSAEGQARALRAAYAQTRPAGGAADQGIRPRDISLLECHATGTRIGDATELEALAEVFGPDTETPIPLGSLKSNLGHLITTAGVAGLIKVCEALRAGERPPTLHVDQPTPALEGRPFRLLREVEPWVADGPRRAAVSAFGFGGNNAHLVVEEYRPGTAPTTVGPRSVSGPVAIIGLGVTAADCRGRAAFTAALTDTLTDADDQGETRRHLRPVIDPATGEATERLEGRADAFPVDAIGLGIPPLDLRQTLTQQLLMLDAGREAAAETGPLPRARSGVFIGMGIDAEVARYGARWRHGEGFAEALQAAGVLGTMPNITANRLNRQLDLAGASCTVSAEEHSGLEALELALRALRSGELDAAVVGAVELGCEPVHRAAAEALLPKARQVPGDAAVALVVKRLSDAERDGDRIYAILDTGVDTGVDTGATQTENLATAPTWGPGQTHDLTPRFGHAHAASGLLHLAAAALGLHHRRRPDGRPWLSPGPRRARVVVEAMEGSGPRSVGLHGAPAAPPRRERPAPQIRIYTGGSRDAVLAALTEDRRTPVADLSPNATDQRARLVLVADSDTAFARRAERARAHIEYGAPAGDGVHFRTDPVMGGLAFVFTSAGSAYHGMGAELLTDLPELGDALGQRFQGLAEAFEWSFEDETTTDDSHRRGEDGERRLWASSSLSQLHAELSLRTLGLRPRAVLGYSSGESNGLFALGAWHDLDAMRDHCHGTGLFTHELGGEFRVVRRLWGEDARWQMWSVLAPVDAVRSAIADESRVHLAIIHTANDCVVGGEAEGCARVVESLGRRHCRELGYNLCVHVPELDTHRDAWLEAHRWPTTPVPDVRFYSGAWETPYHPESERCAQAILGQANGCLDFPAMVERAWRDGLRLFVEHGPGGSCSRWIREILGPERLAQALVVSLDRRGRGVEQVLDVVGALLAAGVVLDPRPLLERLRPATLGPIAATGPNALTLPAHPDPVSPTARSVPKTPNEDIQTMAPAPALPPVVDTDFVVALHRSTPHPAEPLVPPMPMAPPTPAFSQPQASPATVPTMPMAPPAAIPPAARPTAPVQAPGLAAVAAAHTRFLQQQAEVHQRFLAGRTHLQQMAMQAAGGGFSHPAVEISAPPPPPPATQAPPHPNPLPPRAGGEGARKAVAGALRSDPSHHPEARGEGAGTATVEALGFAPSHHPEARGEGAGTATVEALGFAPSLHPEAGPDGAGGVDGAPTPKGLKLDRRQLEIGASGKISEIFGPLFEQQDPCPRQVRMPEPPLLLADRVTGIDAEPGVMGTGTLWTETDVREDSWYLHRGRMPAGILIESGQADLLLISWMGADFLNQGERVYRLLGCTLTFHGDLPTPGETLCYDIHVDGHARHDAVRLFFFHYDCRVDGRMRIAVRQGQAGFFTDAELADSDGILWTPETAEIVDTPRLDPPHRLSEHRRFGAEQVRAFSEGRTWECFGPGFEGTQAHVHTPQIQGGQMLFLEEVTHFEPAGGPWGRGYLRARTPVTPDDWFFAGHFKNDPCMPGTLMFEGCFQALSFFLTALGHTLEHDGWRFQPVIGEPIEMRCRGQVTPASKETVYEVFVEEVIAGPEPTLYADLLCTVDGLKAFHARRVGLRLVPDWPLESRPEVLRGHVEPKPVATVPTPEGGRFALGYDSLLACAWGKPSRAFGPEYAIFDGDRRAPRLPGPPYHFMSRILSVTGTLGVPAAGAEVVVEYDVPEDAWYLAENGCRTMPFAVLLEAALQPCGWLASFVGCALVSPTDLMFRNLDGTGTQHAEVFQDAGSLRTEVRLDSVSKAGGMTIVAFTLRTLQGDRLVYDLKTVFGFFPPAAFENQAGLAVSEGDRQLLEAASDFLVDLDTRPAAYYQGGARLPGSKLDMLSRVTGFWPEGGKAKLGAIRAVKDVHPGDWYFKAHFFQDPVQPGSLGIEAMIQLLQVHMLEAGMDAGIEEPRFEPLALGRPMTWKYRGQVVPNNQTVTCTLELTERGTDEHGPFAVCEASLWVDGLRIYSATNLGMRIVSGPLPGARRGPAPAERIVLDPAVDTWLADHCPTWNRPALPMMGLVDLLASAIEGPVTMLKDVQVKGWVDFAGPRTLRAQVEERGDDLVVTLFAASGTTEVEVASARIVRGTAGEPPAPLPPLDGEDLGDPYARGELFHGPAFQVLESGRRGSDGASTLLDAGAGTVPRGKLHPALLDGALHGIPHDRLDLWSPKISTDRVAYPARIPELRFYGPTPTAGPVRCEVRFDGFLHEPDLPRFHFQLIVGQRVWAEGRLVEACFPKGPLGRVPAAERRAFLRDHRFVPGVRLSRSEGGATRLRQAEVEASDWMPGTIEGIYRDRRAEEIAVLEHVAQREGIHPHHLPEALPLNPPVVEVEHDGDEVVVRDGASPDGGHPTLDPTPLRVFWDKELGWSEPWAGRDLWEGLLRRFVRRVVIADPPGFATLEGRGALFLGNHQVQIESLLITNLLGGLTGRPVVTLANAKHERRWIGWILRHLFSHPKVTDPEAILYFDQGRPASMFEILDGLRPDLAAGRRSFFLHPQGTRDRSCRQTVTKISSTFLDLATELDLPVVPIRFTGGLPVELIEGKLEFPHRYTAQDYWIGRPIEAETLRQLPYAERGPTVLEALNGLGPDAADEQPHPPAQTFERAVAEYRQSTGVPEVEAVFHQVLAEATEPSAQTTRLLDHLHDGAPLPRDEPEDRWLAELAERLGSPST